MPGRHCSNIQIYKYTNIQFLLIKHLGLLAVVLACRSRAKGDALRADIEASCAARGLPKAEVEVRLLDLATLE